MKKPSDRHVETDVMESARCAICREPRPFTREHIWPQGFLKRSAFGIRYSARARRTFCGDLIIKDVCRDCNNGPLSALDDYACFLFDRYFAHRTPWGETFTFEYDYGRLTRWLLKTAFNSARATGTADVPLLAAYAETIRAKHACSPAFVGFKIALVGPSAISDRNGEVKTIHPDATRSGPVVVPGFETQTLFSLRLVMVKSFFFTLAISRETALSGAEAIPILSRLPGEPLSPSGSMMLTPMLPAATALAGIEEWPRSRPKH
jgi:hypothetical protein